MKNWTSSVYRLERTGVVVGRRWGRCEEELGGCGLEKSCVFASAIVTLGALWREEDDRVDVFRVVFEVGSCFALAGRGKSVWESYRRCEIHDGGKLID